jgi:hypothetical protein
VGQLGEGWGKWGQFTSNLRRRWTIPVTAGGCQLSERGHKGGAKGNQQGEKKQGELGHVYMQLYCMCEGMIECLNDISYRVHNNNNRNECC